MEFNVFAHASRGLNIKISLNILAEDGEGKNQK
jgi:hypothetical protein